MNSKRDGTLPSREVYQKWYKTARWKKLRLRQLRKHPYCQCPHHTRDKVKATVADHIIPHKGDTRLFWDSNNLQSLTAQCHDKFKQSAERGGAGFDMGCNVDGAPLNQESDWYR